MNEKDFLPVGNKGIINYNNNRILINSIEEFLNKKHSFFYTFKNIIQNGKKRKMNVCVKKSELSKFLNKNKKIGNPIFNNKIILHQSLPSINTISQKSIQDEKFSNLNINYSEKFLEWKKYLNKYNKNNQKKENENEKKDENSLLEKMNTTIENDENNISINEDNYLKINIKKNNENEKNFDDLPNNILLQKNKNKDKINLKKKKKKKLIIKSKDNNNNSIKYQVLTDLSNIYIKNILGVKNFSNNLYVYAKCINLDSNIESDYLIEQETFKKKYPYELINFYESKIIFI